MLICSATGPDFFFDIPNRSYHNIQRNGAIDSSCCAMTKLASEMSQRSKKACRDDLQKTAISEELSMTKRAAGPSKMYDSFLEGCLGISPTNNLGDIPGPFGTVP